MRVLEVNSPYLKDQKSIYVKVLIMYTVYHMQQRSSRARNRISSLQLTSISPETTVSRPSPETIELA
ncbi:hypothetical protein QVD17_32652 [Tagetes erecta]|uniref:Uncharacterized protein n=1 Tax=Tagetes erecta TaxID=13708 RepID=A0AAD8K2B6_TARER|nr:hypothetical protein QVD17_32652 [Tagetes erecta]